MRKQQLSMFLVFLLATNHVTSALGSATFGNGGFGDQNSPPLSQTGSESGHPVVDDDSKSVLESVKTGVSDKLSDTTFWASVTSVLVTIATFVGGKYLYDKFSSSGSKDANPKKPRHPRDVLAAQRHEAEQFQDQEPQIIASPQNVTDGEKLPEPQALSVSSDDWFNLILKIGTSVVSAAAQWLFGVFVK